MLRKIAILLLLLSCSFGIARAQDRIPVSYTSYQVGYGVTKVYDTFLSPIQYKGGAFQLNFEQMKTLSWKDRKSFLSQHLLYLEVGSSDNPTHTASSLTGSLEYSYGIFYKFRPAKNFRFLAGLQADALAGFVYNSRNGNNPATPKVNLNLGLSGMATYAFRIKNQPLLLRYQISAPFLGAMYASQYGQSYYEMDMEGYKEIIHLASFHNQIILRNTLSLELPLNGKYTFRLSGMNNFYETRINSLDTQLITNSILLGVSYNFYRVSGKRSFRWPYRNVFN